MILLHTSFPSCFLLPYQACPRIYSKILFLRYNAEDKEAAMRDGLSITFKHACMNTFGLSQIYIGVEVGHSE
jgi:hypothetical protein